jgi:hypothetical protein
VAIKQLSFVWFYKIPIEFSDYRPIGLIHGIYKVRANILSNILKHVSQDLIGDNQTAFIIGQTPKEVAECFCCSQTLFCFLDLLFLGILYVKL